MILYFTEQKDEITSLVIKHDLDGKYYFVDYHWNLHLVADFVEGRKEALKYNKLFSLKELRKQKFDAYKEYTKQKKLRKKGLK